MDAVIVEGYEGGGPRGINELSTMVLVPQVVDAVSIPVIASGGIVDPRGFAAALALGAQGIQMATRFIATTQCIAHERYKEALLEGDLEGGAAYAGAGVGLISELMDAGEVVSFIVEKADRILAGRR